jgi:acyl-CoA synthetase (AMP-forming)/AMP-acid ligase II
MAIIDYFDHACANWPNNEFLVFGETRTSYREAQATTHRIVNGLTALGCAKGVKAAVLSGNDPVAWLTVLAIWRAGLTYVPLNPRDPMHHNASMLNQFDCEVLFFQPEIAGELANVKTQLTKIKHFVSLGKKTDLMPEARALQDIIVGQPQSSQRVDVAMDDVCIITATGGTTGKPKGVMMSHRNVQMMIANWLQATPYSAGEFPIALIAAPITHAAGPLSMLSTLRGGKVAIMSRVDPVAILNAIEELKVTELFLPPTAIYSLLETPGVEARDYSSLKYFIYAAAPMAPTKLRRALATFGPVMMQGYGQSEATGAISCLRPEEHLVNGEFASDKRLSSCGRVFPLVRVTIRDDANNELRNGETGEICVAGDNVMKGYYDDKERTDEVLVDGWLHTGDVGHFDADNLLHITDRKKDMIITGGFNVYSAEIERVINGIAGVLECAVIGIPDDKWGEAVTAVVQPREGADLTADTIIAQCRENLGPVKTPKRVEFVERLPRSTVGKILKRELRTVYWEGKARQVN